MKKFFVKIINNIVRRALKNEIDTLNRKEKELDVLIKESRQKINHLKNLLEGIDVSVDVHEYEKYSPSWAVISLQGQKSDYIKFVNLKDSDIRDISYFLRRYERNHDIKIDAAPHTSKFLRIRK
jgi:hypothetical protein